MYTTKLRNVGGSVMFAIPKPILESLGLQPNSQVDLSISEGRLVVAPHTKPHYTLSELLAQCDPEAPLSQEEQEWLESPPVGEELL